MISFSRDCINHGVKSISFGGGEPFEYDGIFEIVDALTNEAYISITTNGLPLLDGNKWNNLMVHKPDKVHISIHHPNNRAEVERVVSQIKRLVLSKIKPGVNLLVGVDNIEPARETYQTLSQIIAPDQIILIPQRFRNTPTAKQISEVAGKNPFQSPSCLLGCSRPKEFASVSWDKKVNSCSYAPNKELLSTLTYQGLIDALNRVSWKSCTELFNISELENNPCL